MATKKEICLNNQSFGYYSGFNGLEFKKIEYGVDDFLYCVSGAWGGTKKYHKLKIYYDSKLDCDYIKLHGYKILFSECIRMGAF